MFIYLRSGNMFQFLKVSTTNHRVFYFNSPIHEIIRAIALLVKQTPKSTIFVPIYVTVLWVYLKMAHEFLVTLSQKIFRYFMMKLWTVGRKNRPDWLETYPWPSPKTSKSGQNYTRVTDKSQNIWDHDSDLKKMHFISTSFHNSFNKEFFYESTSGIFSGDVKFLINH